MPNVLRIIYIVHSISRYQQHDCLISDLMYLCPKWFSMLIECEFKKFTMCIAAYSTLIIPWSFESVCTLCGFFFPCYKSTLLTFSTSV